MSENKGSSLSLIKRTGKNKLELTFPRSYMRQDRDGELLLSKTDCYYGLFPMKQQGDNNGRGKFLFMSPSTYREIGNGLVKCEVSYTEHSQQKQTLSELDIDRLKRDIRRCLYSYQPPENGWDIQRMTVRDGSLNHIETSTSSKSAEPSPVVSKNTAKYQYPNLTLSLDDMYDVKSDYDKILFQGLKKSYNSLVDYVNDNEIEVPNFQPVTFADGQSMKDMFVRLRYERDKLFMVAVQGGYDKGVEASLEDISKHDTALINGVDVKETYADMTEKYNQERSLSVYDEDGNRRIASMKNLRFQASYGDYALSCDEQEQLARGDSVILTEVANKSNTGFMNVRCKLEELPLDSRLRGEQFGSLTHTLVVTEELDVTADAFADYDHNEKYRQKQSYYDLLRSSILAHEHDYRQACEKTMKSALKANKTPEMIEALKNRMDAVKLSGKMNGSKDGVMKMSSRNYFMPTFIDSGHGLLGPIVKRRNERYLAQTQERLSNLPASRKGHEKLGFETRYDEELLKNRLSMYGNIVSQKESILEMCVSDAQKQSVTDTIGTYKDLYELAQMERTLRQQPVTDDKYVQMGLKNQWEQVVLETYEENQRLRQSENVDDRIHANDEKARMFDVHKERLDLALRLRASVVTESDKSDVAEYSS